MKTLLTASVAAAFSVALIATPVLAKPRGTPGTNNAASAGNPGTNNSAGNVSNRAGNPGTANRARNGRPGQ